MKIGETALDLVSLIFLVYGAGKVGKIWLKYY
jgi:hypothetical protein